MSEYQYYEFQAVDRLLDEKARKQLRAISSRAHITASSFVNSYDWGDLKADPLKLLERYFDLFVYVANWGTRWFAMKLPAHLVDLAALQAVDLDEDLITVQRVREHVILSIQRDEIEPDWEDERSDGTGWMAALAELRREVLAGDLSLLSLLWLVGVEFETVEDDAVEPPPGLRRLSPALAELAEFLVIDVDLVEVASPSSTAEPQAEPTADDVERLIRALPGDDKVALLLRLYHGTDPHLGLELRRRLHGDALAAPPPTTLRTAGELRVAAQAMKAERQRRAEETAAAAQRKREQALAKQREQRLKELAGRKEAAWREAESLINLKNPKGYERAMALLADLGALADQDDADEDFAQRLAELRARHAGKYTFIQRLDKAGLRAA
jgi:hypothetical protein